MDFTIYIIQNKENIFYLDENYNLIFFFSTINDYLEYLKKPKKIELDDTDDIELALISEAATEKRKKIINKINNNLSNLVKILKKTELHFLQLTSINDVDWESLPTDIKIIIDIRNFSLTDIFKLINMNIPNNILFTDKYNPLHNVNVDELKKTYFFIKEYAKTIKDENMSPAESVFYIYDKIRKRLYAKESNDLDASSSRDLSNVITGEKIVCLGYANLFSCICNYLEIPAEVISWAPTDNTNIGHASNIVYLNDKKYQIKGAFAFDITWDSKRNEEDEDYVNKCPNAFLSLKYELKHKLYHNFELLESPKYGKLKKRENRLIVLKKLKAPAPILTQEKILMAKALNEIRITLDLPPIEGEIEEAIKNLENSYISEPVLYEILQSVRSIEHKLNPSLYSDSLEDLQTLIKTSLSHKIHEKNQQSKQILIKVLLKLEKESLN